MSDKCHVVTESLKDEIKLTGRQVSTVAWSRDDWVDEKSVAIMYPFLASVNESFDN